MASGRMNQVVGHLRTAVLPRDGGALTDGQLLEQFLARRDQDAFAALVRRHGPMVLGVCRRLLGHAHDAEDAFQATFLILARRAASVVPREAVGNFLYGVAYRTAREARALRARRRAREKQVAPMPHPEVRPAEPQDWRPLLDRELNRLPEKYRAAVVLCDLEGRPRKQVARQLGVPEGTLSSRLATARRRLARRLSRSGLSLSGGALAAALAGGAPAAVPAALVVTTVRAAALVAAGQAAGTTPAAVLMKEVFKAMFLAKLKVGVSVLVVAAALGAGGAFYSGVAGPAAAQAAAPEGKPPVDVEALRKENELLKLNLQLTLEKILAQEAELRTLRGQAAAAKNAVPRSDANLTAHMIDQVIRERTHLTVPLHVHLIEGRVVTTTPPHDPVQEVEGALKALREARDKDAKKRAADALETALKKLREQLK
jgi:RNA polymerase sigma factor (sigma-70 family)